LHRSCGGFWHAQQVAAPSKGKAMQARSIPRATRLLQGAVLGGVATMIVGFSWGGWTLESTASQMADDRANAAVVAVLAPICVEKFQRQEDAAGKLIELKRMVVWSQASFIAANGWATMPGSAAPKTLAVARACAELLGGQPG
jgi:hypothetical protein